MKIAINVNDEQIGKEIKKLVESHLKNMVRTEVQSFAMQLLSTDVMRDCLAKNIRDAIREGRHELLEMTAKEILRQDDTIRPMLKAKLAECLDKKTDSYTIHGEYQNLLTKQIEDLMKKLRA